MCVFQVSLMAFSVLSEQRVADETGSHAFEFEADNGISFQVSGSEMPEGGSTMFGEYR